MYISIDIGGTHTRIAGSPALNTITLVGTCTVRTKENFDEGIHEICQHIQKISPHPTAIGIGIAGKVREDGREFIGSTNLPTWTNKSMVDILEHKCGCRVYIENDAVAQSLGEAYYGARPNTDFLYLTWGTGLGGALVSSQSKKIQSLQLERRYLDRWEKKFGGKILEARFGKPAKALHDAEWDGIVSEFTDSIKDVSRRTQSDIVVIGGGIVERQKERISKALSALSSVHILFSKLGEDIGLYGGLALIQSNTKRYIVIPDSTHQ